MSWRRNAKRPLSRLSNRIGIGVATDSAFLSAGFFPAFTWSRRSALQTPLSYRVEDKMRLAKDHRSLKINDSLTLGGIPPETFEYRLGNRSALEWVIDQYQVTEDKHSGIRSDPNRPDDPEYIVRLVGQVIRVSLETFKLVKSLPAL